MSSKQNIGNAEYLEKRIPQNPKYQHVKSRLDTGLSLTKYMERLEEIRKNYRYKKDELFKRLKVTTFAQLVLQVASVSDLNESMGNEEPSGGAEVSEAADDHFSDRTSASLHLSPQPDNLTDDGKTSNTAFSSRTTLQSVISGIGELALDRGDSSSGTRPEAERPYPECPYLLLDVRDRELYDQCHIISAGSFPIANLCRTMNPYTKDVLDYRNVQGKIIILYDEDERIASQAAATMYQRGFDNLFMLSGGLKVMAQRFPEGMTTGSFPASCLPAPTGPSARKHSALQQTPQRAESKQRFTLEDLNKIQNYLDELFVSSETSSRLSSRMSVNSTTSTISSARSNRLGSSKSQSRCPWK